MRAWPAMAVGLLGVLAALLVPLSPVTAQTTTVTWPSPGQPAVSSTAIFAPYRPLEVHVDVPCTAMRAAAARPGGATILTTGDDARSLGVRAVDGEAVVTADGQAWRVPIPPGGAVCGMQVDAGRWGIRVTGPSPSGVTNVPGRPVPQVFGFRTELSAPEAAGLGVRVVAGEPFTTSPSTVKLAVIAVQVVAAAGALRLLPRSRRRRRRRVDGRWRPVWLVDVAVFAVLAGWAVIGPLAVDDGWATMIARNVANTGNPGNYFRWWNAAEVPFALEQQLLAPFTVVSVAPLWLRLPSTVLAVATWLVLTRGVLRGALPDVAGTARIRCVAAACFLACWLPFNLGARPEAFVAFGVIAVLALAMHVRSPAGVGVLVLTAALTVPISPNGVLVAAPILAYATRLGRAVATGAPGRRWVVSRSVSLACVAAVGVTVVFADQSWGALLVATDWHTFFGPSLPWYEESVRYHHLLQSDQQGSFAKRLPVLSTLAMLPVVVAVAWRVRDRSAVRLACMTGVAVALFALSPSKWSYHFGAAAGLFAAFLTVAVVMVARVVPPPDRRTVTVGAVGTLLLCAAVALAFDGPNAWWLPAVYSLPWADAPPRPLGVPLNQPLLWLGVVAIAAVLAASRRGGSRARAVVAAGPSLVVSTAVAVTLALLVGSFAMAPLRRASGSLALVNANRVTGNRVCGLADDVQVMPDGAVLYPADESGARTGGFVAQGGFLPTAPPPDPVGAATATFVWGSRASGEQAAGTVTTPWFGLPALRSDDGVALSVSGRTGDGNRLGLEFGRADDAGVRVLGERAPPDYPPGDENPNYPLWRTIGVDASDVPVGADRVRITATDARADPFGWLAFTGPRLRTIVGLNRFLADHGPVLVSWPQSFLFPCVHDEPVVSGGIAQTPNTVIESPRPRLREDRSADVGGTFAELTVFGRLGEIPSRLVGHPEIDWGAVLVSFDPGLRDAYQSTTTRRTVSGIDGVGAPPPER